MKYRLLARGKQCSAVGMDDAFRRSRRAGRVGDQERVSETGPFKLEMGAGWLCGGYELPQLLRLWDVRNVGGVLEPRHGYNPLKLPDAAHALCDLAHLFSKIDRLAIIDCPIIHKQVLLVIESFTSANPPIP